MSARGSINTAMLPSSRISLASSAPRANTAFMPISAGLDLSQDAERDLRRFIPAQVQADWRTHPGQALRIHPFFLQLCHHGTHFSPGTNHSYVRGGARDHRLQRFLVVDVAVSHNHYVRPVINVHKPRRLTRMSHHYFCARESLFCGELGTLIQHHHPKPEDLSHLRHLLSDVSGTNHQ